MTQRYHLRSFPEVLDYRTIHATCQWLFANWLMTIILNARPLLSITVDCDMVPYDRYVFFTMDGPATPTDVVVL